MVTVKFFGLLRVDNNIKELQLNVGKIQDLLKTICELYPNVTMQQIKQTIFVVNGKQVYGLKRSMLKLNDGDELVLLSPASGG